MQSRVTAALTAANLPTTIHVRADSRTVSICAATSRPLRTEVRAGQIARDTLGPDKAVHNELHVSGD